MSAIPSQFGYRGLEQAIPTGNYPSTPGASGTWNGPMAQLRRNTPLTPAAPDMSANVDARTNFLRRVAAREAQAEQTKSDMAAKNGAFNDYYEKLAPDEKAKFAPKAGESHGSLLGVAGNNVTLDRTDNTEGITRTNAQNHFMNSGALGGSIHGQPTIKEQLMNGLYQPPVAPVDPRVAVADINAKSRETVAATAASAKPGILTTAAQAIGKGIGTVGTAVVKGVAEASIANAKNASAEKIAAGRNDTQQAIAAGKVDAQAPVNEAKAADLQQHTQNQAAATQPGSLPAQSLEEKQFHNDQITYYKELEAHAKRAQAAALAGKDFKEPEPTKPVRGAKPGGGSPMATTPVPASSRTPPPTQLGGLGKDPGWQQQPDGTFTHPSRPGKVFKDVGNGLQEVTQ